MSIIMISSDVPEMENRIAEGVAEEKGYDRLDRRILADAALRYGTRPERLNEALESAPSLFRRLALRRWRYALACIQAEVLDRMLADNLVCWGLAAHLYVNGVSHAMKIRVLSGKEADAKTAEQMGVPLHKSERWRAASSKRRKEWTMAAFQEEEADPSRYDLVIRLDQIDPVEAVRTIVGASEYRKFQSMTYSTKCLTDLALAAKVHVALSESMTDVRVQARDGSVVVSTRVPNRQKRKKVAAIKQVAGRVHGVSYVEVHAQKGFFKRTG